MNEHHRVFAKGALVTVLSFDQVEVHKVAKMSRSVPAHRVVVHIDCTKTAHHIQLVLSYVIISPTNEVPLLVASLCLFSLIYLPLAVSSSSEGKGKQLVTSRVPLSSKPSS